MIRKGGCADPQDSASALLLGAQVNRLMGCVAWRDMPESDSAAWLTLKEAMEAAYAELRVIPAHRNWSCVVCSNCRAMLPRRTIYCGGCFQVIGEYWPTELNAEGCFFSPFTLARLAEVRAGSMAVMQKRNADGAWNGRALISVVS